jgi:hypothetical protein
MNRQIPCQLLQIFESWLSISATCVKWGNYFSTFFPLTSGVRQGGVLSPYLFAIYIDTLVVKVRDSLIGCHLSLTCTSIFLYADDILLIAPSLHALQILIKICETELNWLNMRINVKKSACLRIGSRCDSRCNNLTTNDGQTLNWVNSCRYLGVYLVNSRRFKCNFDHSKTTYYKTFNAIYGKIGRLASEEVILKLIQTKCIPMLIYGTEATPLNKQEKRSLEFPVTRTFMKMFKTTSVDIVQECQAMFRFLPVSLTLDIRKAMFLERLRDSSNLICSVLIADYVKSDLDDLCKKYSAANAGDLAWRARDIFYNNN